MIVFRHSGFERKFRINFTVVDPDPNVPNDPNSIHELIFEAGPQFVRPTTQKPTKVRKFETKKILAENLFTLTNLNVKNSEIVYRLLQKPKFGNLTLTDEKGFEKNVQEFTQADLINGNLKYVHRGSEIPGSSANRGSEIPGSSEIQGNSDFLQLRVFVGAFKQDDTKVMIEILNNDQRPTQLEIIRQQPIVVALHGIVPLSSDRLLVVHPNLDASRVQFWVVEEPKFGRLIRDQDSAAAAAANPPEFGFLSKFSQLDVNEQRIQYMHHMTSPPSVDDFFVLRVISDSETIPELKVLVHVEPHVVSLNLKSPLKVKAGQSELIDSRTLGASSNYYPTTTYVFTVAKVSFYSF